MSITVTINHTSYIENFHFTYFPAYMPNVLLYDVISLQNPSEADAMTKVQKDLDETKVILVSKTKLLYSDVKMKSTV